MMLHRWYHALFTMAQSLFNGLLPMYRIGHPDMRLFVGSMAAAIPGYEPSTSAITEAQKLAKYAASSLGFEDIPTAVKQLTDALKLLTQPVNTAGTLQRHR